MPAFLKLYTDNSHASEVSHTTDLSTTLSGDHPAGSTAYTLVSGSGMPTSGTVDIIDGTNGNETAAYYGRVGNVIQLCKASAFHHTGGQTVNEWYYSLAIGDQTNGIPNDGTDSTPVGANTATWYCYNAGDQTAQSPVLATSASSPSTTQGYADVLVSITGSGSGFATSVSPANIAAGSQQQFWLTAEIANGQSAVGNPQICVVSLTYGTI